jgi:TolB-like protein/DNA-binding winged helix-turn-helix (wHTH) protein
VKELKPLVPSKRFGVYEVDLAFEELRKNGLKIKLSGQPFQVLAMLLERPGEVVKREEIQKKLWPDGTFVDFDHSLNTAINKIREALGDSAESPHFVETLARRGYRFIAPVEGAPQTARPWKGWRVWLPAGLAALLGLFAWQGPWVTLWRQPAGGTPVPQITSLAVLPLRNLTGDPTQEYFVEGMTESLSATFSQIGGLTMISSTSAMRYKNTAKSASQVAQELGGVDALVEGAVQRSSNRARVTVSLVRGDRRVWTGTYERDVADVFALYSEVAQAVAREISVAVSPPDQVRLAKSRLVKPEAYDAYLRGTYFRHRWMAGGCIDAERYFLRAIELDPDFPQPYADLAWCCAFPDRLQRPVGELGPKARLYAARAVELDPTLASAHVALGLISQFLDYDWDRAGKHFRRALELDRSHAQAHISYGEYFYMQGRTSEGVAIMEQSLKLDPFSLDRNVALGYGLRNVRRYDAAIEQFRKTLELEPTYSTAQFLLADTYALKGSYAVAVTEYLNWLDQVLVRERAPTARTALERAYARSGWLGFWRRELELAEEEVHRPGSVYKAPYRRYSGPFSMARRYARLGDHNQAVSALEKAYEARLHSMASLKVEPSFDGLRQDPRFRDLVRRIGLTP